MYARTGTSLDLTDVQTPCVEAKPIKDGVNSARRRSLTNSGERFRKRFVPAGIERDVSANHQTRAKSTRVPTLPG